jgi:hypothetical protein
VYGAIKVRAGMRDAIAISSVTNLNPRQVNVLVYICVLVASLRAFLSHKSTGRIFLNFSLFFNAISAGKREQRSVDNARPGFT